MRFPIVALLGLYALVGPVLGQTAQLRTAPAVQMPGQADSNSPAFWRDGEFRMFTSAGVPALSRGTDQFAQYEPEEIGVDRVDHFPMWFESAWMDPDGTLYTWYHHEPGGVCRGSSLTAPQIGAAVSFDGGYTFYDLGIILSSGDPPDCSAENGFFAGGHGDFSVILDRDRNYFYFFFSNYGGDLASQGVAVARMAFEDRRNPLGTVRKYFDGAWTEPGLGGHVTPVFPAAVSWQRSDTNSFWGPSIHWNTFLETYVVLLSHACCKPNWPQEGIYISFNSEPSNPAAWTTPQKILHSIDYGPGYYPQVLGIGPLETDTLAAQLARLYVQGHSKWEILFSKEIPPDPEPEPDPDPPPEP